MREKSSAYDVIMLDDPWAPEFMSKGWLADLDQLGGGVDEDFVGPARDVSRHPVGYRSYYAVPFVGNVELFAYNKAMFDKHDLARPESWTDVLAAARTISEAEEGVAGAVFRGKKANPIVTGFLPILWAHGARIVTADGAAGPGQPGRARRAEYVPGACEVRTQGCGDLQLLGSARRHPERSHRDRHRGLAVLGPVDGRSERFQGSRPDRDHGRAGAGGRAEADARVMAGRRPGNLRAQGVARNFIDFLTSPAMQKRLALEVGTPPTRASVYADPEVISAYRWYPAQVAALQEAQPRPRTAAWSKLEAIMGDYLQLALIGEMSPEDALAEANEKIARVLER